jgi:hypothetical protein
MHAQASDTRLSLSLSHHTTTATAYHARTNHQSAAGMTGRVIALCLLGTKKIEKKIGKKIRLKK